jgi:hypothetical protein
MEIPGLAHVHLLGLERQHERGFDISPMDAKPVFLWREQTGYLLTQRQVEPAGVPHHHAQSAAQVSRHQIHQADVAAMAVEQHQPVDSCAVHAFTQLHPHAQHGVSAQGQGTGKRRVFVAEAYRLGGQK